MKAWLDDLKEMNYWYKAYFALVLAAYVAFVVVVVLRHGWPDWWNLPPLFIGIPLGFFVTSMMLLFAIILVGHASASALITNANVVLAHQLQFKWLYEYGKIGPIEPAIIGAKYLELLSITLGPADNNRDWKAVILDAGFDYHRQVSDST